MYFSGGYFSELLIIYKIQMLVGTKYYGLYKTNHTLSIVYCGTLYKKIITKLHETFNDPLGRDCPCKCYNIRKTLYYVSTCKTHHLIDISILTT